jgi:hypothetical protein
MMSFSTCSAIWMKIGRDSSIPAHLVRGGAWRGAEPWLVHYLCN